MGLKTAGHPVGQGSWLADDHWSDGRAGGCLGPGFHLSLTSVHLRCYLEMFLLLFPRLTTSLWALGEPLGLEEGTGSLGDSAAHALEEMELTRSWLRVGCSCCRPWCAGHLSAPGDLGAWWAGPKTCVPNPQMPPLPWIPRSYYLGNIPAGHRASGTSRFLGGRVPCSALLSPSVLPDRAGPQPALPASSALRGPSSWRDSYVKPKGESPGWGQWGQMVRLDAGRWMAWCQHSQRPRTVSSPGK